MSSALKHWAEATVVDISADLSAVLQQASQLVWIAGDRTEHLHWRLTHGEGPKDLKPRAVVVLVGTNDLSHVFDVIPPSSPS